MASFHRNMEIIKCVEACNAVSKLLDIEQFRGNVNRYLGISSLRECAG